MSLLVASSSGRAGALGVGSVCGFELGRLPRDLLLFARAKRSKQEKARPGSAPLRGTLRCSEPGGRRRTQRPIGASDSRRLPYPPSPALLGASRGGAHQKPDSGSLLRNLARAKQASAVAGDSIFAARSAVQWTYPSLGRRREAQCSGGMEAFDCPRRLWGAEFERVPRSTSIAGNPRSGRRTQGVLSFGSFSLHKQRKGTPAEGDPTLNHNESQQSASARRAKP